MHNKAMERELQSGECLDVLKEGIKIKRGLYKLNRFVEGVDYADSEDELWIWSIGENLKTGEIFASTTAEFYQNNEFNCLFLR